MYFEWNISIFASTDCSYLFVDLKLPALSVSHVAFYNKHWPIKFTEYRVEFLPNKSIGKEKYNYVVKKLVVSIDSDILRALTCSYFSCSHRITCAQFMNYDHFIKISADIWSFRRVTFLFWNVYVLCADNGSPIPAITCFLFCNRTWTWLCKKKTHVLIVQVFGRVFQFSCILLLILNGLLTYNNLLTKSSFCHNVRELFG